MREGGAEDGEGVLACLATMQDVNYAHPPSHRSYVAVRGCPGENAHLVSLSPY